MSRTRTPRNSPDPRHRFHAVLAGSRAITTPYEIALDHLLHETKLPESFDERVLKATEAALTSFDVAPVRGLFDASLLGLATADDLAEAFSVSKEETEAYAHLFFDRSVFANDFHVIAYIGTVSDKDIRELLQDAHTKGFRMLRFKYAADTAPPAPDQTLMRMFEADARQYLQEQNLPLSNKRVKEVRALGKQVLSTAQTLAKVPSAASAAKSASETDVPHDFVIQSGPLNPTLDELLSKGVEIIH